MARKYPVAITACMLLIIGGLLTSSTVEALEPVWLQHLGYSSQAFWEGRWERFLTAGFVTEGGHVFWSGLACCALLIGLAEKLYGSRQALLTPILSHTITLTILATGFRDFSALPDVGPSAGYFGCLGLLVRRAPRPLAYLLLVEASLLGWLVFVGYAPGRGPREPIAALAHAIAFPLGYVTLLRRANAIEDGQRTLRPVE